MMAMLRIDEFKPAPFLCPSFQRVCRGPTRASMSSANSFGRPKRIDVDEEGIDKQVNSDVNRESNLIGPYTAVYMTRSTPTSKHLNQRSEKLFPGGVNSPVRAFRAVGGEPPIIVRAKGSRMWDADGNEYIDYVGSWGPMILGHADPEIVAAVKAAAGNGTSFGASTDAESDLGELVREAFPSIEMMRF